MTNRWIPALILFLSAGVLAQPASAQPAIGLKGGVSLSTLQTEPDSSDLLDRLTDFAAGVFVASSVDSPLAGQVDVLVSRRGAKLDGDLFGAGFLGNVATFRVTYLDISALLRVNGGAGNVHFYGIAGPTISAKLKSELSLFGFGTDVVDSATESWDVAATVGAGVDLDGLVIEGRYSHGLRDVIVGADVLPFDAKLRTITVLAGFRF